MADNSTKDKVMASYLKEKGVIRRVSRCEICKHLVHGSTYGDKQHALTEIANHLRVCNG